MRKIFIIDDEPQIIASIEQNLPSTIYDINSYNNAQTAFRQIGECRPELILLDLIMPEMNGFQFLESLKAQKHNIPVIIISGENKIDSAVKAMKLGAVDFITKPFDFEKLNDTINQYLPIKSHQSPRNTGVSIIGDSEAFFQIQNQIAIISRSPDTTVLICGETGTGKELVARKIHEQSERSKEAFIEINCSAIQETLLESELFGHEKGAFTGAGVTKKGLLEIAHKGTFFLDEIGDMPTILQAKLLKVLEQKKIRRLGGLKEIELDLRFLCATSRDLFQLMKENKFRQDLYYRISVATITLAPLRERKQDIEVLAKYFLKLYNEKFHKNIKGFSRHCLKSMAEYNWPGNVRELKNFVEREVLFQNADIISELTIITPSESPAKKGLPKNIPGKITLDQLEKDFIIDTLKETNGNQVQAANILNITRSQLKHRIKRYNIDVESLKNGQI
ncbi:MAG: sigma-54-dependent Fis family transcriptional regulator [Candidatus Marinimicrobia bacterium]|nr:sigma-54-dependent Fis family transcriptional regulator [Candidatus Neomarinimicrobiota bacterium]